jgi:hypothetical protein
MSDFNLKQDWNWNKIIFKADDWIHQQAYDNAYDSMLEYLEIGSEDELTQEHLDECNRLIEYLEAPYDKGGLGMDMNGHSQTYYAYYRVMQDWIENFDYDN